MANANPPHAPSMRNTHTHTHSHYRTELSNTSSITFSSQVASILTIGSLFTCFNPLWFAFGNVVHELLEGLPVLGSASGRSVVVSSMRKAKKLKHFRATRLQYRMELRHLNWWHYLVLLPAQQTTTPMLMMLC